MDKITEYLPFLLPIIIMVLALAVTALIHVLTHQRYRFGSRTMWVLIVLILQIIGPVAYFAFGRGDE